MASLSITDVETVRWRVFRLIFRGSRISGPKKLSSQDCLASSRYINGSFAPLKFTSSCFVSNGTQRFFPQAGDSTAEELATATQVSGPYLPIVREKPAVELVKVTEEMKSFKAYDKIRLERTNARHEGKRKKRAQDAEKDEKK